MKSLIVYSSNTGNAKKMAEMIYKGLNVNNEWELKEVNELENPKNYEVVLLGGWAEGGSLNKVALSIFEQLDKDRQKIGLFMAMGSRVATEHGTFCKTQLEKLLEGVKNLLGYQLMQGKISQDLIDKLAKAPASVIPESVKIAMQDGVDTYKEPMTEDYQKLVDYLKKQL